MEKLLIVEDEKLIRQGIKAMISRSNVPIGEILECNNGKSALDILKTQRIDVMFTDIRMPHMDGIELVREMQSLEHRPLTVVISGYDDFSYAVEMLRTGVKEYILKPVDRVAVRNILVKLEAELAQRRLRNEENRKVGIRRLKYFLMNEDICEEEMQSVAGLPGMLLPVGKYRILCTWREDEESEEREDSLCLGEVDGNFVYVLAESGIEKAAENEWEDLYAGVSTAYEGITEIKSAYREAAVARKSAFCRKKKWVRYDDNLREEESTDKGKKREEKMENLAQLIGTERFRQVLTQLEQITAAVKLPKGSPEKFEKTVKGLTRAVVELYGTLFTEDKEEPERYLDIYRFSDIDSFMEEYMGFLIMIHERLAREFGDYRNRQKIKQALIYIGEHFDKDLNMAVVSNYISMNYSLFSYEFKEYTGKNFVMYLKEMRLKEAKRLLAESDLKVMEIGQQAGYENEKHFMKVFKAEYGITPSEYRKNMQLSE